MTPRTEQGFLCQGSHYDIDCSACGSRYNTRDQHNCSPRDWAIHQNNQLRYFRQDFELRLARLEENLKCK